MKAINRRVAIGMMALSLAFGAAAGFSGHASAMPIGGVGSAVGCAYFGQQYGEGAVITSDGLFYYVCTGGRWQFLARAAPTGGSGYPVAPVGQAAAS